MNGEQSRQDVIKGWNTKPTVNVPAYELVAEHGEFSKFHVGFSGGPVCHKDTGLVFGMVGAIDDNRGYAIPIQIILEKYPNEDKATPSTIEHAYSDLDKGNDLQDKEPVEPFQPSAKRTQAISESPLTPELMKIIFSYKEKYRHPITKLIEIRAREILDNFDDDRGIEVDRDTLNSFYTSCFSDPGIVEYRGSDTNIPSKFIRKLGVILEEHIKLQEKYNNKSPASRILLVSDEDLLYDYYVNYSEFVKFYKKHKEHNILLYQTTTSNAKRHARENGISGRVKEIGIWKDKYAILLRPSEDDRVTFYICIWRRPARTVL